LSARWKSVLYPLERSQDSILQWLEALREVILYYRKQRARDQEEVTRAALANDLSLIRQFDESVLPTGMPQEAPAPDAAEGSASPAHTPGEPTHPVIHEVESDRADLPANIGIQDDVKVKRLRDVDGVLYEVRTHYLSGGQQPAPEATAEPATTEQQQPPTSPGAIGANEPRAAQPRQAAPVEQTGSGDTTGQSPPTEQLSPTVDDEDERILCALKEAQPHRPNQTQLEGLSRVSRKTINKRLPSLRQNGLVSFASERTNSGVTITERGRRLLEELDRKREAEQHYHRHPPRTQ
jgi:hypothetical protein